MSERERQAHIYNRQLLQDFNRAQDTINDLMARTTAMNTLRVNAQRALEKRVSGHPQFDAHGTRVKVISLFLFRLSMKGM